MKFIIEHMEDTFSDWSILEYKQISIDLEKENNHLLLTSVNPDIDIPGELKSSGIECTHQDVQNYLPKDLSPEKVCLLDPQAPVSLSPDDAEKFDYFLFGGILGDHPPRDRTGELRKFGYIRRNLDKVQMTTDTAVRVAQIVMVEKKKLDDIAYLDFPELRFSRYESVEMPFRYVADANGNPILPEGMRELIRKDSEKGLDDLI